MEEKTKKINGQFYTKVNPFNNDLFYKWVKHIENFKNEILLEPFAGANNIVKMINDLGYVNNWECFDINPPNYNNFSKYSVVKRDVILDFPENFKVSITNPPYLAKNSAIKDGLPFPNTTYDDLYKLSLHKMLDKLDYVAAIIPESFITQNLFQNRLFGIVSLNCKMFDDTECPVCLAFFVPKLRKQIIGLHEDDFYIYRDSAYWGLFSEAKKNKIDFEIPGWKFNSPNGLIGLYAIDNTKTESIAFVDGSKIDSSKIKHTSRGITKIDNEILKNGLNISSIIDRSNQILKDYRHKTSDLFLTSFRGLRSDGNYRRRLDFNQAKKILSLSIKMEMENA